MSSITDAAASTTEMLTNISAVVFAFRTITMLATMVGETGARADLTRLRGRFYQGDCSWATPGNGLALSLVDAVAKRRGATTLEVLALDPDFCADLLFAAGPMRQP